LTASGQVKYKMKMSGSQIYSMIQSCADITEAIAKVEMTENFSEANSYAITGAMLMQIKKVCIVTGDLLNDVSFRVE